MMKSLSLLCVCACLVLAQGQKKVCEPLDDGPYLGTQPVLNFYFDEATQEELTDDCQTESRFLSPLRVSGGEGEYSLSLESIPMHDPLQYTSQLTCAGTTYLALTTAIDRDGFTSSLEDDVSFIPAVIKCTPTNGVDTAVVYDARFFIRDINDNMPVFPHDNMTAHATISEALPASSVVMTVVADDKDANLEKNITYSLLNHQDVFTVDSTTGSIMLKSQIDYDAAGQENHFDLILTAEDGGPGATHTVTTTAHVHITDSDDQGPAFVYPGCFKHNDVCAWPKYTADLSVKKNQPIQVYPVPNKVKSHVAIEAYDKDMGINNEIVFSVASTIPPGTENDFRVETKKSEDNKYTATVIPLKDLELNEGYEIFLKAEEQSLDKKHEIAMIFFTGNAAGPGSSSGQNSNGSFDDGDDDNYSDREVALIAVTAILATLVVCLLVALLCCMLRKGSKKGADIPMVG